MACIRAIHLCRPIINFTWCNDCLGIHKMQPIKLINQFFIMKKLTFALHNNLAKYRPIENNNQKAEIYFSLKILLFCFFASILLMNGTAAAKKAPPSSQNDLSKIIEPFDTSLNKIPSLYRGVDIVRLHSFLKRAIPNKTEFESMDDYKIRFNRIIEKADLNATYAFYSDGNTSDAAAYYVGDYDAEGQNYNIEFSSSTLFSRDTFGYNSYEGYVGLVERNIKKASYIGVNAFGHSLRVNKYESHIFSLKTINPDDCIRETACKYDFSLHTTLLTPVPKISARETKKHLRLLILASLRPFNENGVPIIADHQFVTINPSTSIPEEKFIAFPYVSVVIRELWVFDQRTGDVLSKKKIDYKANESH